MLPALLLHGLQWFLACLSLDLAFRTVDVRPEHLPRSRARWARFHGLLAAAAILLIGAAQIRLLGEAGALARPSVQSVLGALVAGSGWLPWWLLWHFGWRKQFPPLQD